MITGFVECFATLRKSGCRCALRWSKEQGHPIPFTKCELKLGDRNQCWFIDDLRMQDNEALHSIMRSYNG